MELEIIKEVVRDIKASIPLANNTYVVTGYEISLEIIKSALKERGIDASFIDEGDE